MADSMLKNFLAKELRTIVAKVMKEQRSLTEYEEQMEVNVIDVDDDDLPISSRHLERDSDFDNHAMAERSARDRRNSNFSRLNKSSSGSDGLASPGKHLFD